MSADSSGRVLTWNRGAERLFGWTADEMVGRPLTVIIPERFRALHHDGIARVRRTGTSKLAGKVVELAGLRRDGSELPIELSIGTWTGPEGMAFSGVLRDITERRRAEAELAAASKELERANAELETLVYSASTTSRAQWCPCSATSRTPSATAAAATWWWWSTAVTAPTGGRRAVGPRQRQGDPARAPRARVRGLRAAGGPLDRRGHRDGPGHLPQDRRGPGRGSGHRLTRRPVPGRGLSP